MRNLFTAVGLLGTLLIGLSAFEINAESWYSSQIDEVKQVLVDNEKMIDTLSGHKQPPFTGATSIGWPQVYGTRLDAIVMFERGWLVVACAGVVLLFVGVRGLIISRKAHKLFGELPPST